MMLTIRPKFRNLESGETKFLKEVQGLNSKRMKNTGTWSIF